MNYTLNDLKHYIETERYKSAVPREHFRTIAIMDFCNMSHEEFVAETEVCRYVKGPHYALPNILLYNEFRRLFEEGLLDIVQLTGRQKLMFLTCLSDPDCTRNMMIAAAENEEEFCKLQKALPAVVCVLRDSVLYEAEQVKTAHKIARWFMECNQRVLNYRKYIDFARQVFGKEIH